MLGLDPQRERRELLPRIGVMLQSGGAWSGVRAMEMLEHMASLHAHPLDRGRCWASGWGSTSAAARPTAGSPAGSSSGSGWRSRWSAGPSSSSSTSRRRAWTRQARRTTWELLEEIRADGVTVVLTTHHMDEAEHLADRIHIIDRGRLIASGPPGELTRGGRPATIRLVVDRPFPPRAPESLRAELGPATEVQEIDAQEHADPRPGRRHDARHGLGLVRGARRAAPDPHLGQRNLEDVFLQLTGRELAP